MSEETREKTPDDRPLFTVALRLVAETIPEKALAWLWTIHRQYGEWDCSAHRHGQACCVDALLESAQHPQVADHAIGPLAEIITAGYDLIVESAGDDRNGEIHIFLTHPDQRALCDDPTFAATPATLPQAIEKARTYAAAFPKGVTP